MSYAIDVYRGDARPMRRFTDYMCFEAFFPDLVAGPIIRYAALEEQMRVRAAHARQVRARRRLLRVRHGQEDPDRQSRWGTSPTPRSRPARCTPPDAWFGLVGYAFQIYFDFSGYSDMAVRPGADAGLRPDPELRFALPGRQHHRLLAALAHQPVDLAARLPLHPARRQPPGRAAHLRQPDGRHAARRAVARRQLELRALGRDPRRHAGVRARPRQQGQERQDQRLPATASARSGSPSPSSSSACAGCSSGRRRWARRWRTFKSLFGLGRGDRLRRTRSRG